MHLDEEVSVADFSYEAIYEDGMIDRVDKAAKALQMYYAEQDAKK